jgi:transposase
MDKPVTCGDSASGQVRAAPSGSPRGRLALVTCGNSNRKWYATDLTEAQWAEIEGFLDPPRDPSRGGRPQQYSRRRIADTIFYQLRTGVQWHLLPGDLPPWTAVWKQFCRWRDAGVWLVITGGLVRRCRAEAGRDPEPSAALLDAQSVPSGRLGHRDQVGVR